MSSRAGLHVPDSLESVTPECRRQPSPARAGVTPAALMLLLQHVRRRKRSARAAFAGAWREHQQAAEAGAARDEPSELSVVAGIREAHVGAP